MAEHHTMALWVHPVVIVLGVWLITSPFTLGYHHEVLAWSDVIGGMLLVALSAFAMAPGGL
jgi:hypothetical protein